MIRMMLLICAAVSAVVHANLALATSNEAAAHAVTAVEFAPATLTAEVHAVANHRGADSPVTSLTATARKSSMPYATTSWRVAKTTSITDATMSRHNRSAAIAVTAAVEQAFSDAATIAAATLEAAAVNASLIAVADTAYGITC